MVKDSFALLPTLTDDYEVIVINDGSMDRTASIIDELSRSEPKFRVIHHTENQGYGAALRSGFSHATKDLVFYTDGDAQYDVRELADLFPLMKEGVDVVNGYKIKRFDRRRRKVLGAVYNRLARLFFRVPIRDVDCDFRLMRRRTLRQIEIASSSGVVCVEMVYKLRRAGAVFTETPVHHHPRIHGTSQFFTFTRVARTALDFFSLWFRLVAMRSFRSQDRTPPAGVQKDYPLSERHERL